MKLCCSPSRLATDSTALPAASSTRGCNATRQTVALGIPRGQTYLSTKRSYFLIDGEGLLRHKKVSAFHMDAASVPNAQFRAFVSDTGYVTDAKRHGDSLVFQALLLKGTPPSLAVADAPWWRMIAGANWRDIYGPRTADRQVDDHPVVHVSSNDANAYAA